MFIISAMHGTSLLREIHTSFFDLVVLNDCKFVLSLNKNYKSYRISAGGHVLWVTWYMDIYLYTGPVTGIGRPGLEGKSAPPPFLPSAAMRTEGVKGGPGACAPGI